MQDKYQGEWGEPLVLHLVTKQGVPIDISSYDTGTVEFQLKGSQEVFGGEVTLGDCQVTYQVKEGDFDVTGFYNVCVDCYTTEGEEVLAKRSFLGKIEIVPRTPR
jgi:hypothetical protein